MSASFTPPFTSSATRDLWKVAETGKIGQLIELLARGADVNGSNQAGVTALMLAAYHGQLEMVRALTDHGADVNATDRDGFTAAMLAHHSHREDIVSLLVARGARIIPTRRSAATSSAIPTPYQTSNTLHSLDPAEKRTLEAPPNIWDVVHETHVDFDPRAAFFGHLKAINPHVFALIALIVGGGAVLGFIWLRSGSDSAPATSAIKTEASNNQIIPSSPTNPPDTTVSSSDQPSGSQVMAPVATASPSPQQSAMNAATARLASSALNPKSAATPREPVKKVAAKPGQSDQKIATPVGNGALTGTDNIDNSDKAPTATTPAAKSEITPVSKPDIKKSE